MRIKYRFSDIKSVTTVCLTPLETVHGPESYESLHQVTFLLSNIQMNMFFLDIFLLFSIK